MKGLLDPTLLAAAGGDTVKLFDVSAGGGGDQSSSCVLSYVPSPGLAVHSLKWNHTNLVVASAGEDKKISLWRKHGQSMGTIPVSGTDSGDGIEESILAISFSSKSSRYICSGGSGQVVRIWDLQRKRCIKWLRGHTSTITGAMYNCKDDSLVSIGVNGNIILHNLASGAKASELKDPDEQVLRVLDFSRVSRHLLVVAGDDGTVRLWDKNSSSPKISWLKQHLAPAAGISFSPTNDKMIASVGLDKKLYTFDSSSKRPSSYIAYESPFSSLAFRDDGLVLAAGTSNGRIVLYDIRAKPQPLTVLTAYSSSEAVTSLCWQRAKPVRVNESTCSAETALLGGAVEDSVLMPDPLPSMASSGLSSSKAPSGPWNPSRSSSSLDAAPVASTSGSTLSSQYVNTSEETPHRSHLWPGGNLARLNAPRTSYSLKDEMGVFSPLMTPITPALDKLWNDTDGSKKDPSILERKPSFLFPSASQRFPFVDDRSNDHPISSLKSSSSFSQDDSQTIGQLGSAPAASSSKSEDASVTPPEAWGGEKLSDRFARVTSRFGLTTGSVLSGYPDVASTMSQTSISSLTTSSNFTYTNSRNNDLSSLESQLTYTESFPSGLSSPSLGMRSNLEQATADPPGPTSLAIPRLFSSYAERRSSNSAFNDGTSVLAGSPKVKKTGAETREELLNSLLSRSYTSSSVEMGVLPPANGGTPRAQAALPVETQQASSFSLQLFERTLVETLDSFQKSIHGDMRNLHIEVLRQSHMNQMDMSRAISLLLENQAEMKEELQQLRKENQLLRQLL
ncbi:hypothetical protein MLD38_018919 [Melastoma candidum]|uniref:Uncharacterized protein n=1 Tax=Melastoma candidum TaxID=119954 RepID=A0ACB9QZC0_9MYRT|nr:hypothetical protein MLD38_018919 [Melastoma candidum]